MTNRHMIPRHIRALHPRDPRLGAQFLRLGRGAIMGACIPDEGDAEVTHFLVLLLAISLDISSNLGFFFFFRHNQGNRVVLPLS